MHRHYDELSKHPHWLADNRLVQAKLDALLSPWAQDKGSLTAALIDLSDGKFQVNVLRQMIAKPYFHEQQKLGLSSHQAALIREVELQIHTETVIFARSVIPLSLASNGAGGLSKLGRTPLGHLLFKDGRIRVSKRQFAFLELGQQKVIARRTPYEYLGSSILVAEFFLPAFRHHL